ncbi:unnamed protein product [Boreogadus saida]
MNGSGPAWLVQEEQSKSSWPSVSLVCNTVLLRGRRRYGRRWRRAGGFRRANVGGEGWFDLIRSRPVRLLSTSPSLVPAIPAVQWPCRLKRAGPLTSDPHQEKVASA